MVQQENESCASDIQAQAPQGPFYVNLDAESSVSTLNHQDSGGNLGSCFSGLAAKPRCLTSYIN